MDYIINIEKLDQLEQDAVYLRENMNKMTTEELIEELNQVRSKVRELEEQEENLNQIIENIKQQKFYNQLHEEYKRTVETYILRTNRIKENPSYWLKRDS